MNNFTVATFLRPSTALSRLQITYTVMQLAVQIGVHIFGKWPTPNKEKGP